METSGCFLSIDAKNFGIGIGVQKDMPLFEYSDFCEVSFV
jgi:hypothetical protein